MQNTKIFILFLLLFSVLSCTEEKTAEPEEGKFYGAKETEIPSWFKDSFLDLAEDVKDASSSNKSLLVFFHQRGCPYCNLMVEKNFSDPQIKSEIQRNMDVVGINMWGDSEVINFNGKSYSEKDFAVMYKVQFTPTMLFFNKEGKELLRLNGYIPVPAFKQALDYVTNEQNHEISYAKYIADSTASMGETGLIDDELFLKPPFDLSRLQDSKILAVLFAKKDCPECVTLHKKVLADKEIRGFMRKMDVVQLDIKSNTPVITTDGRRLNANQWAEELKINYIPSLVFFDSEGTEVIRSEAMFKVFHTQSIFDYVHSGSYKEQPEFQRYLSERVDKIRHKGIDVDIWH